MCMAWFQNLSQQLQTYWDNNPLSAFAYDFLLLGKAHKITQGDLTKKLF